jgi:hypothetical protein
MGKFLGLLFLLLLHGLKPLKHHLLVLLDGKRLYLRPVPLLRQLAVARPDSLVQPVELSEVDKGSTAKILGPFLDGMREAGASVELFYAKQLDVKPCTGEYHCLREKTLGQCYIDARAGGGSEESAR